MFPALKTTCRNNLIKWDGSIGLLDHIGNDIVLTKDETNGNEATSLDKCLTTN